MVRTGSFRPADTGYSTSRLAIARSFLGSAETAFVVIDAGEPMNPVVSHIVLSAIAYGDALTAKFGGKINQKDHTAVISLLRDALGNRFPKAMETILKRILGVKDEFQYGVRPATKDEAEKMLFQLRAFASWAEDEMSR